MSDSSRAFGKVKARAKSTVKQVLRLAGRDVELASWLGMKSVKRSDTFIVSYPKSGNTWVRFLIANSLQIERPATFHDLDIFVPDLHKYRNRIDESRGPRFIKTHYAYCERFPRLVYICRDGRDVMVSFYYFQKQLGRFRGTFSEFLRSGKTNVFGMWRWHEHVAAAWREKDRRPNDVLFIRYEDLLDDPYTGTEKILDFCHIRATDSRIQEVVERCSFGRLQEVEKTYGGAGKVKSFMRRGTRNQWPDYFTDADLKRFYEEAGDVLRDLGYLRSEDRGPDNDTGVFE